MACFLKLHCTAHLICFYWFFFRQIWWRLQFFSTYITCYYMLFIIWFGVSGKYKFHFSDNYSSTVFIYTSSLIKQWNFQMHFAQNFEWTNRWANFELKVSQLNDKLSFRSVNIYDFWRYLNSSKILTTLEEFSYNNRDLLDEKSYQLTIICHLIAKSSVLCVCPSFAVWQITFNNGFKKQIVHLYCWYDTHNIGECRDIFLLLSSV